TVAATPTASGRQNVMFLTVVRGPNQWVATGTSNAQPAAWWSNDGITWSLASLPGPVSVVHAAAADSTSWILSGVRITPKGDHGVLYRSVDGRAWERATVQAGDADAGYVTPFVVDGHLRVIAYERHGRTLRPIVTDPH